MQTKTPIPRTWIITRPNGAVTHAVAIGHKYIGQTDSKESALEAARRFIATGERPPKRPRPKYGKKWKASITERGSSFLLKAKTRAEDLSYQWQTVTYHDRPRAQAAVELFERTGEILPGPHYRRKQEPRTTRTVTKAPKPEKEIPKPPAVTTPERILFRAARLEIIRASAARCE